MNIENKSIALENITKKIAVKPKILMKSKLFFTFKYCFNEFKYKFLSITSGSVIIVKKGINEPKLMTSKKDEKIINSWKIIIFVFVFLSKKWNIWVRFLNIRRNKYIV